MRENIKVEVALEILSMCMAEAISNNDNAMINEISKLKQRIYLGNIADIDEIIENYGKKVKSALEENNGQI